MNEEFKDIKVKAGNIDKEGFIHVKAESQGGGSGGILRLVLPQSMVTNYVFNPACFNTVTPLTDQESVAFCDNLVEQISAGNRNIILSAADLFDYYPSIYFYSDEHSTDFEVSILAIQSVGINVKALMHITLRSWGSSADPSIKYAVDITLYELTQKQLG